MRWIDISTPITSGMAAFPGDPAVEVRRVRSITGGDPYNLSELSAGTHAGTHVDPPLHFIVGAPGIDRVPLERLNGPCLVWPVGPGVRSVGAAELAGVPPGTQRLLLRTSNSARWAEPGGGFFADYVALTEEGARAALGQGISLIGIDALSIETDPTGRFPVHHLLLSGGVVIVEGLRLAGAAPGAYELRLMPLRIEDGDGGPARAALLAP